MMQGPWRLAFGTVLMGLLVAGTATAQEQVPPPASADAEMGSGAAWLQSTIAPQHINLDAEGRLRGELGFHTDAGELRLVPNMPVSLTHRGRVIARVLTNAKGVFSFSPVEPGFYTLHASNPEMLLVLPVLVGPRADSVEPFSLIAANPIAPSRRTAMLAMLRPRPVQYPDLLQSFPRGSSGFIKYRVMLTPQGTLTGKIRPVDAIMRTLDMTGMMVRLTRNGSMVGEGRVRADGTYTINNVSPGPVSVFVYGPQGFAAFGIQIVPPTAFGQLENSQGERFVLAPQDAQASLNLNVAISTPEDTVAASQIPGDSFSGPAPTPTTGAPGGGNGGFGGGGGGGGLGGGALGLGALGAAAAALAGDDDGPYVPAAASPGGP